MSKKICLQPSHLEAHQIISDFKNGAKKATIDAILGKELGNEELNKVAKELSEHEIFVKDEDNDGERKTISK